MLDKILIIILVLLCCTATSIATQQMCKCDFCGFYRTSDEMYVRAERNPNYLQNSLTSNVNYVCKYCIHRLNYPERNLFKLNKGEQHAKH